MDDVPFHVFSMKESDYIMSLMSTYGTNERCGWEVHHDWKENGIKKSTTFQYPEVVDNHFKYRHYVDDHNGKRHSPISMEVVWATKHWPNRVFTFLLSISEVNCWLAETQFMSWRTDSTIPTGRSLPMSLLRMPTSKGRRYRSNSAEVQDDQGGCWKKQAMGWCQYHQTKNLRMVG